MYLNYNAWPQSFLGPKLLSKKEVIEKIVCYQIFGDDSSYEENMNYKRESLRKLKKDLNNLYSYLKRLDVEADKLYDSYVKRTKKENYRVSIYNKNIIANSKMFENIAENLPIKLSNRNYYTFCNCEELEVVPILDKRSWLNGEKIHYTHCIDHQKHNIEFHKKDIISKIKQYYKLKNHLMK